MNVYFHFIQVQGVCPLLFVECYIYLTIKTCAIFGDSLIYLLFEDTLGIEHNQIIVVAQVFPVELVVLRHLQLEILLREGHESGK